MPVDERILEAIEAVYEAALDETLWHGALQKLADVTGSQAATFWVLDGSDQPRLPTFSYVNLDPKLIEEYLDGMAQHDPTVQYLVRQPALPIVHDGLFITEREKDRHLYYDWHHRYSDTRFRLIGRMSPAPAMQAGIALLRARNIGRFERDDIEQFAILHRHLERALALSFRLGSLGTLQRCCTELLDRNPDGILLLDAQQRVVYANDAARRLCNRSDGLNLSVAGLSLARKQDAPQLRKLIAQALAIHGGDGLTGDGVMAVHRPCGKRPYLLLVAPLARHYPALSTLRPAVSIVITDPEARPVTNHQRLRLGFNLTDAEARLAALLAAGDSLQSAAEQLGIHYGTARARLTEIFRKTDTHRQSELIRLVAIALAL